MVGDIFNLPFSDDEFDIVLNLVEEDTDKHNGTLNGYKLDALSFQILKKLSYGEGIQTNEHFLAGQLGVHRKIVERRIALLLNEKVILPPVCRFPRFMVPPDYTLVIWLVEVKKHSNKIVKAWQNDPHIPFILKTSTGSLHISFLVVFTQ